MDDMLRLNEALGRECPRPLDMKGEIMKCPRCGNGLGGDWTEDKSSRYLCSGCGWASPSVNQMVLASPAYRLAKLQAEGAAPGWYGPDGRKLTPKADDFGNIGLCVDGCGLWAADIESDEENEAALLGFARRCGFVEVVI
jgi:predicted RNA-binding Zn-ribbon protein involved in translation (DUF1610 family)